MSDKKPPVHRSIRDLFRGDPVENTSLQRLARDNEELMVDKTPEEEEIRSFLPGHEDEGETVAGHIVERLIPTGHINFNPQKIKEMFLAGELSAADIAMYQGLAGVILFPRRGEPEPDQGGITRPYTGTLNDEDRPAVDVNPTARQGKYPVVRGD